MIALVLNMLIFMLMLEILGNNKLYVNISVL